MAVREYNVAQIIIVWKKGEGQKLYLVDLRGRPQDMDAVLIGVSALERKVF